VPADPYSDGPVPGEPSSYPADRPLAEVLRIAEEHGYGGQFDLDDEGGGCRCGACGTVSSPDEVQVDSLQRLEGASDPAEMSAVLEVTCPNCGQQGTVVCRYGPEASPGEAALLRSARGASRREPD
jgi:hypothetical protein